MRPFGSHRWHRALVLFTGLFILAVITQFGVGWYQRYTKVLSSLSQEAEEIKNQLVYSEQRNLTQYRQAELVSLSYYVLDNNGFTIDIEGFVPAMNLRVRLDDQSPGLRTVTVPETGETWRLFVKRLSGGIVTLGVSPPEDITNVDERLEENANRFGSSLERALNVVTGAIDRNLDYVILDGEGRLRYAVGGIPLRIASNQRYPSNRVEELPVGDSLTYGVFSLPFRDSAKTGGVICAFKKLDPQPWFSLRHWIVNCLTSAVLAIIGTLIGIPFIGEKFEPRSLLRDSLLKGESSTVEFKGSLRWTHWQTKDQLADESQKKLSEEIAVRTVVALLNHQAGGTLIIGISDDKKVVGLERDYGSLTKRGDRPDDKEKSRDRFQVHFRNLVAAKVGRDVSNLYIQTAIVEADSKDVCVVHARPASIPIYLSDGKTKLFYVRDGASTVALDVEQVVAYVEKRWPKSIWRRIRNTFYIL